MKLNTDKWVIVGFGKSIPALLIADYYNFSNNQESLEASRSIVPFERRNHIGQAKSNAVKIDRHLAWPNMTGDNTLLEGYRQELKQEATCFNNQPTTG